MVAAQRIAGKPVVDLECVFRAASRPNDYDPMQHVSMLSVGIFFADGDEAAPHHRQEPPAGFLAIRQNNAPLRAHAGVVPPIGIAQPARRRSPFSSVRRKRFHA